MRGASINEAGQSIHLHPVLPSNNNHIRPNASPVRRVQSSIDTYGGSFPPSLLTVDNPQWISPGA